LMDYRRSDGTHGLNQHALKAYGRAGEPCHRCRTTMKEVRLGGRSTVFCPRCQR